MFFPNKTNINPDAFKLIVGKFCRKVRPEQMPSPWSIHGVYKMSETDVLTLDCGPNRMDN